MVDILDFLSLTVQYRALTEYVHESHGNQMKRAMKCFCLDS